MPDSYTAGDRPATSAEEIEITPEMVEAGALVLLRRFNLEADEADVVSSMYRAMEEVRRRSREK